MGIWFTILMSILPALIQFLLGLVKKGERLTGRQLEAMNHAQYYLHQANDLCPKVGCSPTGVPPPSGGIVHTSDYQEVWAGLA